MTFWKREVLEKGPDTIVQIPAKKKGFAKFQILEQLSYFKISISATPMFF